MPIMSRRVMRMLTLDEFGWRTSAIGHGWAGSLHGPAGACPGNLRATTGVLNEFGKGRICTGSRRARELTT